MNDQQRVKVEIKHQIAHVSLSRGDKHNALDMKMFQSIAKTIKALRQNRNVRVVILDAEGPDFCTGLDVKSVMSKASNTIKLLFKWRPWGSNLAQQVSTGWRAVPAPVIAVIHGRCWGGGLQIALGADFRICKPDASLSVLEARWGLIPDMGGTLPFRELCRMDEIKELSMTGRMIDGEEAQKLGLVSYVSEDPMAKAEEMAEEFCKLSPDSLAGVKKLLHKNWWGSRGMALFRETWYQFRVLSGKNQRIKTYNQTHDAEKHKLFKMRKKW